MTNKEYIKLRLSDIDLAELFTKGKLVCDTNFNKTVQQVFKNWMKKNDITNRNFEKNYENIEKNHSVFGFWERICNEETDSWIPYGRTKSVKFQQWLSMQYNPEEWKIEKQG